MIIAAVGHDGSAENVALGDFTELSYKGTGAGPSLAIFYKTADGTETKEIFSVDGAQAEDLTWRSWVFSADGTIETPTIAEASGNGTHPDPAQLSLSKDAVVIAVVTQRGDVGGSNHASAPAGYTQTGTLSVLGGAGNGMGWGLTSVSTDENPGTFGFSEFSNYQAGTIGITVAEAVTGLLLRRRLA